VGDKPDATIFAIPGRETGKVGIFVNEEISIVMQAAEEYHLDLVQLHGDESPEYCRKLDIAGIPVIKVLNPNTILEGQSHLDYETHARYLLFDTPGKELGGTGRKFDWDLLDGSSVSCPFFLSGGIGPKDSRAIREIEHPALFGVDVNSKFELAPGIKDTVLLERFMQELRV